ncbi:CoA transferase [Arthrobacter sp. StoSoilA2]|uniref:CoA transferase n=1 Tax=Arthrobacter sp. StoSoilA2 TaxID=2830990 RepID=UPI001CC5EF74|nr:CoA transferase [Arthrobacter sp. StoSoilA2]
MSGALNGIKVVDFGHFIAGPLLAELLAQNGAEVVHVDPPGGPRLSGKPDAFLNRGKSRVTLDLHNDRDRRRAQDLIAWADVVVENFRPGVMGRLGLGPDAMCSSNPRLIYCSLPGFATDDPRASMPGWEGVVMSATAGYRRLKEHWDWKARAHVDVADPGKPLFTAIPIASNTAAFLGALEVVVALIDRDKTGRGARLEVPLSEALLEVVGFHLEFPGFVGAGDTAPRPFLGSFRCADGGYVDQVPYPRFVERLLRAAGVWEEWVSAGLADMGEMFADPARRGDAELRFAELMRSRPSTEWEAIAIDIGTPFARVRTPAEWLVNEHAQESGAVTSVDDPEYGPITMAGAAIHFSRTSERISRRSLPGGDSEVAVSGRLQGRRASGQQNKLPAEAPLTGISVVELSQVVAGPIAGRLLADYGAHVIKVANPDPSGNNGFHGSFTNRGKHTAFLNVQSGQDLNILQEAIKGADVLLQNYAFGAVERYGLGFETLSEQRPDLVYVSLSAYSRQGPWKNRRGHENQAVAATGLSVRYGGTDDWPIYQPYLISDVGTGILGALAAALGLFELGQSGLGQHISTSLVQTATIHQGVYLFDGTEAGRMSEPTGTDAVGWSALQRLYQAADGWLFLGADSAQVEDLIRAVGIPDCPSTKTAGDADGPFAQALAVALRQRTCATWASVLAAEDIGVQEVREITQVAHDPIWQRRNVIRLGKNGERRDNAPILGHRPRPWPIPADACSDPGPLGAQTSDIRAQFQPIHLITT